MRLPKRGIVILLSLVFVGMGIYPILAHTKQNKRSGIDVGPWKDYNIGNIVFNDKAPQTKGSKIFKSLIPNPEKYIADCARKVLATLYFSPKDKITPVDTLYYSLEDIEGVSGKSNNGSTIYIFLTTGHIENVYKENGSKHTLWEFYGVMLHELTHAYQLCPQGIGNYGSNRTFWAFIEGMADAVRIANGGSEESNRPRGGSYTSGYSNTGYFFIWLRDKYDPDFLRKLNLSTLEVIPWSFDGAIKQILGEKYSVDKLWLEYQIEVGDIQ